MGRQGGPQLGKQQPGQHQLDSSRRATAHLSRSRTASVAWRSTNWAPCCASSPAAAASAEGGSVEPSRCASAGGVPSPSAEAAPAAVATSDAWRRWRGGGACCAR